MMDVRTGLVATDPAGLRLWRLILPAPDVLWSSNDAHRGIHHETSRVRKAWRGTTFTAIKAAGIPQGLARVHFTFLFHFVTDKRRDSLNYAETAKPIEDAFAAPFVQRPTKGKPGGAVAPGALVIADDTDEYVEDNVLRIGPLWQDVITADGYPLDAASIRALDRKWGGVTVEVRERPALPPVVKRKRPPLKDVIPADVRRRIALEGFLG